MRKGSSGGGRECVRESAIRGQRPRLEALRRAVQLRGQLLDALGGPAQAAGGRRDALAFIGAAAQEGRRIALRLQRRRQRALVRVELGFGLEADGQLGVIRAGPCCCDAERRRRRRRQRRRRSDGGRAWRATRDNETGVLSAAARTRRARSLRAHSCARLNSSLHNRLNKRRGAGGPPRPRAPIADTGAQRTQ